MDKRTFLRSTSLLGLATFTGFRAISKLVDEVAYLPAARNTTELRMEAVIGLYTLTE